MSGCLDNQAPRFTNKGTRLWKRLYTSFYRAPEGFTIKPLDPEGLEGNHLTALTYFRGNLYAATLSGLYYKKWEEALK